MSRGGEGESVGKGVDGDRYGLLWGLEVLDGGEWFSYALR